MVKQEADVEDLQQRDLTTVQVSIGLNNVEFLKNYQSIPVKVENAMKVRSSIDLWLLHLLAG